MYKIIELKKQLDNLRPLNKLELERFYNDFIIENTYNSNAIEGSTVTLDETYAILDAKITISGKSTKEYLDTINHSEAFYFLLDVLKSNQHFDENLIKQIHSLVLANDRDNKGQYRKVNVRVGSHKPPEPYLVPIEMENLVSEYSTNYEISDIAKIISEFHLRFETIHPFIDGNGRTGRLLLNFMLMKKGFIPINIKFEDRERYYKAFYEYNTTGSIDFMTSLVTDRIVSSMEDYIKSVTFELGDK